jgi:cell division septation protein DedD
MDVKQCVKNHFVLALAMALTLVLAPGCSSDLSKSVSKSTDSSTARSQSESEKAAAEAEAAEEEFAKAKNSNSASNSRHVASAGSKKPRAEQIYLVQVGTFKLEENAKKIEAKLKAAGLPVFQKKIERASGALFAVRIEPTPNRSEAEKFVASVKSATGEESLILSVGR